MHVAHGPLSLPSSTSRHSCDRILGPKGTPAKSGWFPAGRASGAGAWALQLPLSVPQCERGPTPLFRTLAFQTRCDIGSKSLRATFL